MSEAKRLTPAQVLALLRKKWDAHHATWLVRPEAASWPMSFRLHTLTEKEVSTSLPATRDWVQSWRSWDSKECAVEWVPRRWTSGNQELPDRLLVPSAQAAASILKEAGAWDLVRRRYSVLCERFPSLGGSGALARRCDDVLASYSEPDFARLVVLMQWLVENPKSGLYLRQLPVPDVDTKWVEGRKGAVGDIARQLLSASEIAGFHEVCGLRTEPFRMRVRILCPQMRSQVGGLSDIEAPAEQLAALPIRPQTCIVVENLNTGIALPNIPEAVAFMRLGLAVDQLDPIPWLHAADRQLYWGDLDTHGFAALARARRRFPRLTSLLMDEATLQSHRSMWVREDRPSRVEAPEGLTPEELAVYSGLRTNIWGEQVRLEQERIAWPVALDALRRALCL
jgi:hypothetical protein